MKVKIQTEGATLIAGDICKVHEITIEICWIDPEKTRPNHGQYILFQSAVGIYEGEYHNTKSGYISFGTDVVWWEDVYQWIPKPKDF